MNEKKYIIIFSVACLLLIIGLTYAYWGKYYSQENPNVTISGCIDVSYQSETEPLSVNNALPLRDTDGLSTDDYSFTIRNNCTNSLANYDVTLELLANSGNRLEAEYLKINLSIGNPKTENTMLLSNFTSVDPSNEGYDESYILGSGVLGYNESVTYSLRMWIDWDSTIEQSANKALTSKVVVKATPSAGYQCGENNINTLADCVIAKAANVENVVDAKTAIKSKNVPLFENIDPVITYEEVETLKQVM